MRIGEVFGSVTLSKALPEMHGMRYVLVQPESAAALRNDGDNLSDPLVAIDEYGANNGARIAFSEGREASMPFSPADGPTDAYVAAILDNVTL